jgi:hypothetical protein
MTVDRAGSFDLPIDLATDLAVLFFGFVGADLLEEEATRFGPSPMVFLFFSATRVSDDTGESSGGGLTWRRRRGSEGRCFRGLSLR